jgi:hypothetical protein
MQEIWKDIPGYEGIYEASSLGRIRTAKGKTTSSARFKVRIWKQRIMKQKCTKNKRGRKDFRVTLWKDGVEKTWLVARLIALAFYPISDMSLTVNHKDGNPLNNRADNLEWMTIKENIQYGFENNQFGTTKPVTLKQGENKKEFFSMSKASHFLGRNTGYVSLCLKKHRNATDKDGVRWEIIL